MIAGIINSDGNYNNPKTKKQTYELGQKIISTFEEKHKTSICYDLKGFKMVRLFFLVIYVLKRPVKL